MPLSLETTNLVELRRQWDWVTGSLALQPYYFFGEIHLKYRRIDFCTCACLVLEYWKWLWKTMECRSATLLQSATIFTIQMTLWLYQVILKPWTSCFSIISSTLYVVVGHRAVGLLQVLVTSPCRGGAAEIYNWHYYIRLLQGRLLQGSFPTHHFAGQQGEASYTHLSISCSYIT